MNGGDWLGMLPSPDFSAGLFSGLFYGTVFGILLMLFVLRILGIIGEDGAPGGSRRRGGPSDGGGGRGGVPEPRAPVIPLTAYQPTTGRYAGLARETVQGRAPRYAVGVPHGAGEAVDWCDCPKCLSERMRRRVFARIFGGQPEYTPALVPYTEPWRAPWTRPTKAEALEVLGWRVLRVELREMPQRPGDGDIVDDESEEEA